MGRKAESTAKAVNSYRAEAETQAQSVYSLEKNGIELRKEISTGDELLGVANAMWNYEIELLAQSEKSLTKVSIDVAREKIKADQRQSPDAFPRYLEVKQLEEKLKVLKEKLVLNDLMYNQSKTLLNLAMKDYDMAIVQRKAPYHVHIGNN